MLITLIFVKKFRIMGRNVRRQFDSSFKTKVVIEALRERKTLTDLCKEYDLHPNQISDWKKLIMGEIPSIFDSSSTKHKKSQDIDIEEITSPLYQQIGQLTMELDYLKKKSARSK
jgi:transposase-like protein